MSYSLPPRATAAPRTTGRPNINHGRGQGFGRGTVMNSRNNTNQEVLGMHDEPVDETNAPSSTNDSNNERRMEYCGSYSMVRPDQKKRSQISEQAQRETQQYEQFKEAKRVNYVSYVGTVGGDDRPSAPGRSRLVDQQPSRYQKLEQRNRYRVEAKLQEERENEAKKAKARRQSELNAELAAAEHSQRAAALRNDHQRRNQAFLDRLENRR